MLIRSNTVAPRRQTVLCDAILRNNSSMLWAEIFMLLLSLYFITAGKLYSSINTGATTVCKTLTLKAPIAIKVVCFYHLLKCLRSLYDKQCGPRLSVLGPHCLLLYLNSSLMLGNYLQQTTSVDDIFRCIFSWTFKG